MRTDQFIGLTDAAEEFVREACIPLLETAVLEGAFGNIFYLGKWKVKGTDYNVEEKVQMEPWSSGPMYFTYLVIDLGGYPVPCFPWQQTYGDTELEFDPTKGEIYI